MFVHPPQNGGQDRGQGMGRLTARQVETAAPKAGQKKLKLQDGGGLTLVVRAKDRKYWTLRVPVEGRTREIGLGSASGPYDAVSLADARDRAYLINKHLRDGVALSEAVTRVTGRKAALNGAAQPTPGGQTFKEVAKEYIKRHEPSWKSAVHARQWATTLEDYAYPIIGHKLPGDVTTADVIAILKQPVKDKKKKPIAGTSLWNTQPENASRIRGRIEKIIAAWKVESGQQDKFNPAQWAGHLQAVFPKKSKLRKVVHHAALPWAEVPALMAELVARVDGARGGGVANLALRFLILTATRTNEVLSGRWPEIDRATRLWSIPGERMKMGVGHVVPLSDAALAVLAEAERYRVDGNAVIFPGVTYQEEGVITLSNMALLMLLKRLRKPRKEKGWALTKKVTAHGFRSSFRDWCADNGHDRELAEAALAHAVGDAVEAAYKRSQMVKRRAPMMAAWAAYLLPDGADAKAIAAAKEQEAGDGKVVPIRKGRR